MRNYWNNKIETMDSEQIKEIQLERLQKTVVEVYKNVPYYKAKMENMGILPEDIKCLEDLKKMPFTSKDDLRETYPFGMLARPMEDIVRIHASSGTTGKQTVVGYTKGDIQVWSDCMARCLVMAGAETSSRIQISYGYGLFTGGLGVHYGAELIGAVTIPASAGNTKRQVTMLKDYQTTCLCCTPSYALFIAETMEEINISKHDLNLKSGIFGAEPWSCGMRKEIEDRLGIKAYDIYGLSEIMGPSVSQECEYQDGLHVWEDCYLVEVVDPKSNQVLNEGEFGNLVITTINKEGLPLIRYKTGDICSLISGQCGCGRTHIRMSKPRGRTDDMLIIKGVNIFPSQIESILMGAEDISPNYQIIVNREGNLDMLQVNVEVADNIYFNDSTRIHTIHKKLSRELDSVVGINANINLVKPKTIIRSEGKAIRVIDNRRL